MPKLSKFLLLPLLLLLAPLTTTPAQDKPVEPVPTVNKIVGPTADVDADTLGSEDSPHIYEPGDKGKLQLDTKATTILWKLGQAPAETEMLLDGKLLWFPTNKPGKYLFLVALSGPEPTSLDLLSAWVEIRGPNGPPAPGPSTLTKRVIAGFNGQPKEVLAADALKFQVALEGLTKSLKTAPPAKRSGLALQLQTALQAVGWQPNKYLDLSRLAGELAGGELGGPGVADKVLDQAYIDEAIKTLETVTEACAQVVKTNTPKQAK